MGKDKNAEGEVTFPGIDKFPEWLAREVKKQAGHKGRKIREFVIQALTYAVNNDHVVEMKPLVDLRNESRQKEVRHDTRKTDKGRATEAKPEPANKKSQTQAR